MSASRNRDSPGVLTAAIVVWLLTGLSRASTAAEDAAGSDAERAGAFVGALLAALVIVLLMRTGVRLIRGRPPFQPMWTPTLFFSAAAFNVLLILALLGTRASTAP